MNSSGSTGALRPPSPSMRRDPSDSSLAHSTDLNQRRVKSPRQRSPGGAQRAVRAGGRAGSPGAAARAGKGSLTPIFFELHLEERVKSLDAESSSAVRKVVERKNIAFDGRTGHATLLRDMRFKRREWTKDSADDPTAAIVAHELAAARAVAVDLAALWKVFPRPVRLVRYRKQFVSVSNVGDQAGRERELWADELAHSQGNYLKQLLLQAGAQQVTVQAEVAGPGTPKAGFLVEFDMTKEAKDCVKVEKVTKRGRVLFDQDRNRISLVRDLPWRARSSGSDQPIAEVEDSVEVQAILRDVAEILQIFQVTVAVYAVADGPAAQGRNVGSDWLRTLANNRAIFVQKCLVEEHGIPRSMLAPGQPKDENGRLADRGAGSPRQHPGQGGQGGGSPRGASSPRGQRQQAAWPDFGEQLPSPRPNSPRRAQEKDGRDRSPSPPRSPRRALEKEMQSSSPLQAAQGSPQTQLSSPRRLSRPSSAGALEPRGTCGGSKTRLIKQLTEAQCLQKAEDIPHLKELIGLANTAKAEGSLHFITLIDEAEDVLRKLEQRALRQQTWTSMKDRKKALEHIRGVTYTPQLRNHGVELGKQNSLR